MYPVERDVVPKHVSAQLYELGTYTEWLTAHAVRLRCVSRVTGVRLVAKRSSACSCASPRRRMLRAALRSAWSWCPHAVHRKRACERRGVHVDVAAGVADLTRMVGWHEHDARRLVAQHWLERRPAGREHDAIEPGLGTHVRTGRLDGAFGRTRHRPGLQVLEHHGARAELARDVVAPVLAPVGELAPVCRMWTVARRRAVRARRFEPRRWRAMRRW